MSASMHRKEQRNLQAVAIVAVPRSRSERRADLCKSVQSFSTNRLLAILHDHCFTSLLTALLAFLVTAGNS